MANKKFLVDIDVDLNQLLNGRIENGTGFVTGGANAIGRVVYDTVTQRILYDTGVNLETVATLNDVTGLLDFKGGYDASTNTPNLTTPPIGTVLKGDYYVVTVAGTFFTENLTIGDSLFAKVDNPSTLADWVIVQGNIDYENIYNSDGTLTGNRNVSNGGYNLSFTGTSGIFRFRLQDLFGRLSETYHNLTDYIVQIINGTSGSSTNWNETDITSQTYDGTGNSTTLNQKSTGAYLQQNDGSSNVNTIEVSQTNANLSSTDGVNTRILKVSTSGVNINSEYTFPNTDGTANQVMATDGSGNVSWTTNFSGTVTSVGLISGTWGTDVNIANSPITTSGDITINIPIASAVNTGKLSSSDWTVFNNKVSTTRQINTVSPLQGGGDLSADRTLTINLATSVTSGYLSSTDWNTFNNKQNAITLTTLGTSGVATFIGDVLNIPDYSGFTPVNIYNADGTLTGDRTLQMATYNLDLIGNESGSYQLQLVSTINPQDYASYYYNIQSVNYQINDDTNGFQFNQSFIAGNSFLSVNDLNTNANGQISFNAGGSGISYFDGVATTYGCFVDNLGININNVYRFPNTDGTVGQVLTTDGSGNISWQTTSDTNIYNSDGTVTAFRTITFTGQQVLFTGSNSNQTITLNLRASAGSGNRVGRLQHTNDLTGAQSVVAVSSAGASLSYNDAISLTSAQVTASPTQTFLQYNSGFLNESINLSTLGINLSYQDAIDTTFLTVQNNGYNFNGSYILPKVDGTAGQVLTTDGAGVVTFEYPTVSVDGTTIIGDGTPTSPLEVGNLINLSGNNFILSSSTQWSKTLPAPVTLPNGGTANGCTFFTDANLVTGGTTLYNYYPLQYGIQINLSGTSGTANINVFGVNYLATFSVSLTQTALNWVTANQPTLYALGLEVFAIGGSIRFGYPTAPTLDAITITNLSGDLTGTKIEPFTGLPTAQPNHLQIPYVGTPYEGLRILHTIRTNFNISTGSVQYATLGLYRYQDDSLIGSTITILRTPDTTGTQNVLESYTNGATDPFVTGGFYVAVKNNTGVSLDFIGNAGILIQNIFQKPVNF